MGIIFSRFIGVNDISGIWQSYTMIILGTYHNLYIKRNNETATTSQSQHVQMHSEAGSITRGGECHTILSKACFTEHLYMTGIYQVYVCRIHSAGLFLFSCTLLGLPGLISAAGRFRLGLSADPSCLSHRKSINSRLRHVKDPHPGVDLTNMAALACSLACTVGTPEFNGLLLS